MSWYVYIIKCSDSSYYTGISTNVNRRTKEHNGKKGAKSLFGKLPVALVYKEKAKNQVEAAKREREIKGWSHLKKEALVQKLAWSKQKGLP